MTGFNDTLRGFGHGIERVINTVIEARDSDEISPPDIPESQTFNAVFERNKDFIENCAGPSTSATEVKLGEPPSDEMKASEKVPAIPTVLNNVPAQSPFALRSGRSSHDSKQSSNESEKRDVLTPLENVTVRNGNETLSPTRSQSVGSRDSFEGRPRVGSIEIGSVNPRNFRTAIQLGERPRTESQSLGTVDEYLAGRQDRVVRRRVVLPYQITLAFGAASIIGVGIGIGILVISVRNAVFLRGPKAGPQLPEIKDLLIEANAKLTTLVNALPRRLKL